MKNLFNITCALLIFGATSCSTIDEQAITSSVEITEVNEVLEFSNEQTFFQQMDINQDGTIDFMLRGHRGMLPEAPHFGNLTLITLTPIHEENQAYCSAKTTLSACNAVIEYNPVKMANVNEFISATSGEWSADPVFYAHMVTTADCNHFVRHMEHDGENIIPVRFINDGAIHYGWFKISAIDITLSGCPESAEKLIITEFGYNPIPEHGVTIQ
jgi:hypothetical protein